MKIERLKLKKLNNTRDIGGLPLKDGRVIKKGLLYRSGKLYRLPKKTVCALEKLGISTIVDMRIGTEAREKPETKIGGATYIHLPIITTATPEITDDEKMITTWMKEKNRLKGEFASAREYMLEVYKKILFSDAESLESLKKFFKILLETEGGILWHCAGGKDRTGIVSMLVEGVLGADEEAILADFMASGTFQKRKYAFQKAGLKVIPAYPKLKEILYAMMDCHEEYMTMALEEISSRYKSIENYCRERLELTDGDIELLKDKYTETA